MKKSTRKPVLRSETLRTLANMDLSPAVGGFDSGAKQCPVVAIDSDDRGCVAVAVATVACG